jgi:hypothetical protein
MRHILVIDTSVLCVWLEVPEKETCGPLNDLWDKARVDEFLEAEEKKGTLFVLPLAVIIETGNHIAQSKNAWECANALCKIIRKTIDTESPWADFSHQDVLWSPDKLRLLVNEWPEFAKAKFSIGDMTIKTVAEYYAESRYVVHILTGDDGLKAYEPVATPLIPRRYQKQGKSNSGVGL